MSKKKIGSKLADGLRRAREKPAAPALAAPAPGPSAPPAPAPVARSSVPASAPRSGAKGFARQADQSPPASLDRPWDNLHPARIWPD